MFFNGRSGDSLRLRIRLLRGLRGVTFQAVAAEEGESIAFELDEAHAEQVLIPALPVVYSGETV